MHTFKTPKGTELPFLNLKGKDYLQVAHRIVWFREMHPDWPIITTIVSNTAEGSIVCAEIHSSTGTVLATAHKAQSAKGFPGGYLEKAESGAVGRALAFLGFGTAFAQELEESETDDMSFLADTPLPNPAAKFRIPVGKNKGKLLDELTSEEINNYINWARDQKDLKGPALTTLQEMERYVK